MTITTGLNLAGYDIAEKGKGAHTIGSFVQDQNKGKEALLEHQKYTSSLQNS